MILPSEADQEQVIDAESLIAVSIPVVNGGDLGSTHDQLWKQMAIDKMSNNAPKALPFGAVSESKSRGRY